MLRKLLAELAVAALLVVLALAFTDRGPFVWALIAAMAVAAVAVTAVSEGRGSTRSSARDRHS